MLHRTLLIIQHTHSEVYDNGRDQHAETLNYVSEDVYVGCSDVDVRAAAAVAAAGARARILVVAVRRSETTVRVRVLV